MTRTSMLMFDVLKRCKVFEYESDAEQGLLPSLCVLLVDQHEASLQPKNHMRGCPPRRLELLDNCV